MHNLNCESVQSFSAMYTVLGNTADTSCSKQSGGLPEPTNYGCLKTISSYVGERLSHKAVCCVSGCCSGMRRDLGAVAKRTTHPWRANTNFGMLKLNVPLRRDLLR